VNVPLRLTTAPHLHTSPTTSYPHAGHVMHSGTSIEKPLYGSPQYGHFPVGRAHASWNISPHPHFAMMSPLENGPKQMLQTSADGLLFERFRPTFDTILFVLALTLSRTRRMKSNAVKVPHAAAANNIVTMYSGYANSNKSYAWIPTPKMFRNNTKHFRTRCLNTP
jgi:hypothetical protein